MKRLIVIFIFLLAIFSLFVGDSSRGNEAAASASMRHSALFLERVSGVVAVNPRSAEHNALRFDIIPGGLAKLFYSILELPVGPNVLTNQDQTDQQQNEPSISVNPQNPLHIIATSNDYRLRPALDVHPGYYVSFDGGKTFTYDGVIQIDDFAPAGGDPAITIHDYKNVYYAYIAFHRSDDNIGGVYVSKSIDGGKSWIYPPTQVAQNSVTVFHDKEYIAVDATGSPYDGNVYVSWTRFSAGSPIYFSRSTDGGATFSTPFRVSDNALISNQGSVPAVGPDGTVYVTWYNYDTEALRMAKSTNGGQSFGAPFHVADVFTIPSPLPGAGFRDNSFPAMAVDPTTGYLFVTWGDYRNGDADVYVTRSTDDGQTWDTPIRVNDDLLGNDRHQFFPWISASGNGSIYISWFDSRNDADPINTPMYYDEYAAVSTDGGITFSDNARISEVSSDSGIGFNGTFIGDYSGTAATNHFLYPAWVDTRRGHQDIYTQMNQLYGYTKSSPAEVERDVPYAYTIVLSSSLTLTNNLLSDPLPLEVGYIPDSLWASGGTAVYSDGLVTWNGDLSPSLPVTITFQVSTSVYCGVSITNTAVFTDETQEAYPLLSTSNIFGAPPNAAFEPSTLDADIQQVITFTNLSSGTSPLNYEWDFGDGITSTLDSPTHTYNLPGVYTVTLTANDLCGEDTAVAVINVTCAAPQTIFTYTLGDLQASFVNGSTGSFPISFVWDFGDGFNSTEVNPVHPYNSPGDYLVILQASDLCGASQTSRDLSVFDWIYLPFMLRK